MFNIGLTASRFAQGFRNPFVRGEKIAVVFQVPRPPEQPVTFGHTSRFSSSMGALRRAFSTNAATPPRSIGIIHRRAKSEEVAKVDKRVQLEVLFKQRLAHTANSASETFKRPLQPGDILAALRAEQLPFCGLVPPTDLQLRQASRAAAIREFNESSRASVQRAVSVPRLSLQMTVAVARQNQVAEFNGLRVDGEWHPALRNQPNPRRAALNQVAQHAVKRRQAVKKASVELPLPQLASQLRRFVDGMGPVRPAAVASGLVLIEKRISAAKDTPGDRLFKWTVDSLRAQDIPGVGMSASRSASVIDNVFGELDMHLMAGFFGGVARRL